MERQAIFNLRVNTQGSAEEINKTTKATNEYTKSVESADKANKSFEDRLAETNEKVKSGEFTMRGANKLIQEYQQIAMQAGRESPIGREAIAQAAALQDQVTDLRNEVTRLSKDGQAMQGALAIGQTTLAGYTAFKGITALAGVENEAFTQTIVKLQAAQATLMAVEQLRASLEKESVLMLTLKNAQTKLATVGTLAYAGAQKVAAVATGGLTGAMKLLRLALIATGFGAIVVGIGLLIANFEKVKAVVQDVSERFNKLGAGVKLALSIIFPFIGAIRLVTAALEKLGIIQGDAATEAEKSAERQRKAYAKLIGEQRKETDKKIKDNERLQDDIESTFDFEIAKARAAGKDTSELERQKRAEMRKTYIEQIKNLEMSARLNVGNATKMKEIIDQVAQYRKNILKIEQDEEIAQITERTARNKKAAKDTTDTIKEELQKRLELQQLFEDLMIANIDDDNEREIQMLIKKHEREREEITKKYGKNKELLAQLETQQDNELSDLQEKQRKAAADKTKKEQEDLRKEAILQAENNLAEWMQTFNGDFAAKLEMELEAERERTRLLLENDQLTAEERRKIQLDSDAKQAALQQAEIDREWKVAEAVKAAKMSVLEQSVAILGQLGQLGKEGGAFAKSMALTEIAANTAIGFAKGLTIAQASAAAAGPGAAFAFPAFYAQQIAAVLAAANQARKILSTAPNIGSVGGGGMVAPMAQTAPQMSGRNTVEGTDTTTQQQTTKVVVLESDITRTQTRINDIEVRTTF
jgi:hypothetical protein